MRLLFSFPKDNVSVGRRPSQHPITKAIMVYVYLQFEVRSSTINHLLFCAVECWTVTWSRRQISRSSCVVIYRCSCVIRVTLTRMQAKEMNIDLEDTGKNGGFDQSSWLARGPRMDTADYSFEQPSRRLGDEPTGSRVDGYNVGQSLPQLTDDSITNRIPSVD
ncbi:hypothetical protein FRC14_003107 [Serendipita sp. 396]|nr:hypothetical protein FRC14_003107 [Serendipita sp. 396]